MTRRGWLDVAETGSAVGIQFLVIVCTAFGRRVARGLLRLVAAYYMLTHRRARRVSRSWLARAHGSERITRRMVYSHILRFAQVSMDRLFLVRRQGWRFDIRVPGQQTFDRIIASGRGVLFLGAHLGSFESLLAVAELQSVRVNIVGHFDNARMINAALERLDPNSTARLIPVRPNDINSVFRVQDCLDRGEHVAILADRVGLGGRDVEVDFMGGRAALPAGVYILASALRCPVYLVFGLYSEPNRYDIHCEPFAERVVLPRGTRATAIVEYAQRYADRLEHYGRLAPDNWFNFFDFWAEPDRVRRDAG